MATVDYSAAACRYHARMPEPLTSPDNPRIKHAVKLRDGRTRRKTGLFLAEGQREVERAIAAGLRVQELFLCPALGCPPPGPGGHDAPVFTVTEPLMHKLAYRQNPEGMVAVVEQKQWSLSDVPLGADGLLLIAVGVEKPGNLGAMARTAAAAGARGLVIEDTPIDPYNPNAIRASTGAVFDLPTVSVGHDALAEWLTEQHATVWAAVVGAAPVYDATAPSGRPLAIVIGPEDTGLPPGWDEAYTQRGAAVQPVGIPHASGLVDSLNASNAAAVLLFEAVRQRRQCERRMSWQE